MYPSVVFFDYSACWVTSRVRLPAGPLSLSGCGWSWKPAETYGQVAGPPPSVSRRHASANDWLRLAAIGMGGAAAAVTHGI
jgi:hypothetical protein